jgi:hypothetical protein
MYIYDQNQVPYDPHTSVFFSIYMNEIKKNIKNKINQIQQEKPTRNQSKNIHIYSKTKKKHSL